MTATLVTRWSSANARSGVWASNATASIGDFVDEKRNVLADRDAENYRAVLVAVIVLIGVFLIVAAVYLYLCTRLGYRGVTVRSQILKKWGIPYGIKGWIYCY